MPVNVDTVYQTVQALANKEQRGYLTPQEFNLFAIQAQNDIFEQYLYDLDATRSAAPLQRELADSVGYILFKLTNTVGVTIDPNTVVPGGTSLSGIGITGKIFATVAGRKRTVIEIDSPDELYDMIDSKWHSEALDDVFYFEDGFQQIQVWTGAGQITTGITCEAITGAPGLVYWSYIIINEKPVWNQSASKDFDLHESEQADLVGKILKLAGISMEDQELYQAGQTEEALNTQQRNN